MQMMTYLISLIFYLPGGYVKLKIGLLRVLKVHVIDSLPDFYPKVEAWVENVIMEEGNATILTLFVCLLTVLYLRERHRRNGAAAAMVPPHQPAEQGAPIVN